MAKVFIGVDPPKLSATIEVLNGRETVLAVGRFATDKAGDAAMRRTFSEWPYLPVEVLASSVIAHRGSWVCVACSDLDVAYWHPCIEHGGDTGMAQHVRVRPGGLLNRRGAAPPGCAHAPLL